MRYFAKPDTWFKEGTECFLVDDYRHLDTPSFNCGLFRGTYIVDDSGYDQSYWWGKGYKVGDEVEMNEVCSFDEFNIIEND